MMDFLGRASLSATSEEGGLNLRGVRASVQLADLYWVTRDMARVALDASTDMPGWGLDLLPGPHGLIAFDARSLPPLPPAPLPVERSDGLATPGEMLPAEPDLRIVEWGTYGDALSLVLWAGVDLGQRARLPFDGPHVMIASGLHVISPDVLADLNAIPDPAARAAVALLGSCLTMMSIPTVAETRPQMVKLSGAAAGRTPRQQIVTTISLRRLARQPHDDEPGEGGRVYTHQWVVRGHWRQQAVGPGLSERRATWVPSYIKGPEGAPLLYREHVSVWRR